MKWLDAEDVADAILEAGIKLRAEDTYVLKFMAVARQLNKKLKYDVKSEMEQFIREL